MGTPFIIIMFAIILVCIVIAILMAYFMRANSGMDGEDAAQVAADLAPADFPDASGHLPPFLPLPHQTQPLSEIYAYAEPATDPPPLPAPPDPPAQSMPASIAPAQIAPPSGPLPGYHRDQ